MTARRTGSNLAPGAVKVSKEWLAAHNAAVMTVLFLFLGAKLIAEGLPLLGG
jgi:hypothetical protein